MEKKYERSAAQKFYDRKESDEVDLIKKNKSRRVIEKETGVEDYIRCDDSRWVAWFRENNSHQSKFLAPELLRPGGPAEWRGLVDVIITGDCTTRNPYPQSHRVRWSGYEVGRRFGMSVMRSIRRTLERREMFRRRREVEQEQASVSDDALADASDDLDMDSELSL